MINNSRNWFEDDTHDYAAQNEKAGESARSLLLDEFLKTPVAKRAESSSDIEVFQVRGDGPSPQTTSVELKNEDFQQLGSDMANKLKSFQRITLTALTDARRIEFFRNDPLKVDMQAESGLKWVQIDKHFSADIKTIDPNKLIIENIKGLTVEVDTADETLKSKTASVTGLTFIKDAEGVNTLKISVSWQGQTKELQIPMSSDTRGLFRALDSLRRSPGEKFTMSTPENPGTTGNPGNPQAPVGGDGPRKALQLKDDLNNLIFGLVGTGGLFLSIVGTLKLGRQLLAKETPTIGDVPVPTEVKRSEEVIKDAKDALAKERLVEPRVVKQYLYEASTLLTGKLEEINGNKAFNAEQRAAESAKAINEYNAKFFTILQGKNLPHAQMLKNLRVQPVKDGEAPGLTFETMDGKPLKFEKGKITDTAGQPVEAASVRPVYRIPEGLFSNPQLVFQEVYCNGLLGTKQALETADRASSSGKTVEHVNTANGVSRNMAREVFQNANKETAANEMKAALEGGRKAAGENYMETERAALTQLRKSELVVENGTATFRGSSVDLVALAKERIKELEKELEKVQRVKDGKETDPNLPKDKAELTKLEKTLTEKLNEYKPAYEAAVNKNFDKLHAIAGREIPEMMAETELMRQSGEKPGGGGRWKAYVFLFAGLVGLFIAGRHYTAPQQSTPVYAPVGPRK